MHPIQNTYHQTSPVEFLLKMPSNHLVSSGSKTGCELIGKEKIRRGLQKAGKKTLLGCLRSHPVQKGYIYINSNYGQKECFIFCWFMSFFWKRNDLGKGFIEVVRERLHLKICFFSKYNEHIDRDVFVQLLICTLYLKFSQNFKGFVPRGSNKFASAALVLIIQKNTETLYLFHY